MRPSQNSHGDESAHKGEIEQHDDPAQDLRCALLEAEGEDHDAKGIRDCGCEDAFDCSIRSRKSLVGETMDLGQASTEEAE